MTYCVAIAFVAALGTSALSAPGIYWIFGCFPAWHSTYSVTLSWLLILALVASTVAFSTVSVEQGEGELLTKVVEVAKGLMATSVMYLASY
ncbi:hypothetical protein [Corallincola holothuriorum]|nr:hypothetical protein [Corallincola holothuriorum]